MTIAIDNQNNKWFGTNNGISRFDDMSWSTYSTKDGLANNVVKDIDIDIHNNILVTTDAGVSIFDGTHWTTFNPEGFFYPPIEIDSFGNIWWVNGNYLIKYDGIELTGYSSSLILLDVSVQVIEVDKHDNIWFSQFWHGGPGVNNSQIVKFDGTNHTIEVDTSGSYFGFIYAITCDSFGNIWVGTWGDVMKYDGATWTTYTTSDGLAGIDVRAIAIDKQGNKWFGTSYGVSKFDGKNWTTYSTDDGLINNYVSAIAVDAQDNKWFATYDSYSLQGGVSKFDGTHWTTYTTEDGLVNNDVRAIAIDAEGNIWFGTDGGVSKLSYEPTGIKPIISKNSLLLYPNPVQDILQVDLSGKTGILEICNISGKSVLQKQIQDNNTSVDVSGLHDGIYIVRMIYGNQVFTSKIVKY